MATNVKPREKKYRFSSTSTTTTTTSMYPAKDQPKAPSVWYTDKVWEKIRLLVDTCQKEVGWLGYVEKYSDDTYVVVEIYVPPQTVTAAETDIEADAMGDLAMKLLDEGLDPSKLIYWGHSHVNMGVSPSGQDETQIEEFIEHCPIFIRGIYNKKGDAKVDVFDTNQMLIFQCVKNQVLSPLSLDEETEFLREIKDNVKERTYGYTGGGNWRGNGYGIPQGNTYGGLRGPDDTTSYGSGVGKGQKKLETADEEHNRIFHHGKACDCADPYDWRSQLDNMDIPGDTELARLTNTGREIAEEMERRDKLQNPFYFED